MRVRGGDGARSARRILRAVRAKQGRELPYPRRSHLREAEMSAERIRELNDAFRSTFNGGKVVMTNSVYELPDCVRANALVKVATFSEFTGDNDPYEEHV